VWSQHAPAFQSLSAKRDPALHSAATFELATAILAGVRAVAALVLAFSLQDAVYAWVLIQFCRGRWLTSTYMRHGMCLCASEQRCMSVSPFVS
jgi:hypothetical protein